MNEKDRSSRDSPLSLTTSTATMDYEYDDDESWDNGSWDSDNILLDVDWRLHSRDADATSSPNPNDRIDEEHCAGPQSPLIDKNGAIKPSELQCNCLELIMPLAENNDIQTQHNSSHHGETRLYDPNKLPDGTATKTLSNGTAVLVNYGRLLQNEATKRILLQRTVTTYAGTIAKLQSRLKAEKQLDLKLTAAQREIAHLEGLVSQSQDDRSKTSHHTRQQKYKVMWCLTFKLLLIILILWLAVMNVSVHSIVIKKMVEQQINEGRHRKQSFLRQQRVDFKNDHVALSESEQKRIGKDFQNLPLRGGSLSDPINSTKRTNRNPARRNTGTLGDDTNHTMDSISLTKKIEYTNTTTQTADLGAATIDLKNNDRKHLSSQAVDALAADASKVRLQKTGRKKSSIIVEQK